MSATWQCVRDSVPLRDANLDQYLKACSWSVRQVEVKIDKKDHDSGIFELILLLPPKPKADSNTKIPVVLTPHGGPHSAFTTDFSWGNAFLLLNGFAVICVNYRGSTGYGQKFLKKLPGKCGRLDVRDCMAALQDVLEAKGLAFGTQDENNSNDNNAFSTGDNNNSNDNNDNHNGNNNGNNNNNDKVIFDKKRIMIWGGSHGGFLTTHLIGQYPCTFHRAATRNPVIDVAFMTTETDIPDWCYIEGGASVHDSGAHLSAEDYAKFYKMSPISYASKIKTPLLLLLGMKDLRVPPSQGLNFHRQLKARGTSYSRCLTYPNATHSLSDSVATEADVWINVVKHFTAENL